jgi:hypothetical protein
MITLSLLATFLSPEAIGTNPAQLLWLLPLAVAGVVVYKTIKLPQITAALLIRESIILLAFLLCLLVLVNIAIFAVTNFMT